MPYAVVARYVCSAGDAGDVRAALLAMREHSLREPAALAYVVHEEVPEPPVPGAAVAFVLYEQYADRAGFDAHTRTPHFARHIVAHVRPRLLERTVTFCEVL